MKYYEINQIDNSVSDKSVYDFMHYGNAQYIDDIAIVFFNRKIRYKRLFDDIEKCAGCLYREGVRKGDVVTIQALSMPQVTYIFYALSILGATANIIYIAETGKTVRKILEETNSKLFFVWDGVYDKVKGDIKETDIKTIVLSAGDEADFIIRKVISFKTRNIQRSEAIDWKEFLSSKNTQMEYAGSGDAIAAMIFTGGTTGKSKAVKLSNRAMNSLVIQYKYGGFGFERGDTFLNALPPFIAFGIVMTMHVPISLGVTNLMVVDPTPSKVGDAYAKYKPNFVTHGVSGMESIVQNKKVQRMKNLSFAKVIGGGGESVSTVFEKQVNDFLEKRNSKSKIAIGYGMTEVGATVVTSPRQAYKLGTVGIPLPLTNIKIVEYGSETELGYNQEGEVCISSPTMMEEYFNNPKESANVIRVHNDGQKWLHSGDIGRIDEDGFLTIVGRYKRMIPVRIDGIYHKVFPKLIEDCIAEVEGVAAVAVVGQKDDSRLSKLIAFIVKQDFVDSNKIEEVIYSRLHAEQDEWEQINEIRFIESLPRTQIGKVDFVTLEKMVCT